MSPMSSAWLGRLIGRGAFDGGPSASRAPAQKTMGKAERAASAFASHSKCASGQLLIGLDDPTTKSI